MAAVAKALDRLVGQGLVLRQDAPPASLYTLNRQHVAAPTVETMASIRTELLDRLRQTFSSWSTPPVHASMFGSAARQDGDIDSDIDIFLLRPTGVSDEDATWSEQLHEIGDSIRAWTGNRASIIDFTEQDVRQMQDESRPVLADLHRDGIDLAGVPLRDLLGGTG